MKLLLAIFLTACALTAQTDSGAVRVLVSDSTGLAVAGSKVVLTNTATGVPQQRATAADGYATFPTVPRGNYTVEVSQPGFQNYKVNDLSINVDERKLVRVTLAVAAASAAIEVSASADIVQSEQGSLGQVVDGAVAVELPLAGRRYSELALLAPGTTDSTLDVTTRGPGWFVSNGNYQTQNNYTIDGVDNNQGTTNAQSLSAQVVQPSPDSIGEFKVQTNSYSAEFGRSAGAVINVAIKSGTNKIHGSGWYYNRDKALAATPWNAKLIGAAKPDLQWNQFGGTIGGPIVKNKLFYFADYEGFIQDFANQFLVTVPNSPSRGGVFYRNITDPTTNTPFPDRTIPASRFDPLGKKLVDLYPAPNLPGRVTAAGQTVENFGAQRAGHEETHKSNLKGDYNLSAKDIFSFRWSTLRQDIFRNGIFEGIADGVGNQGAQFNTNHSFGGTWTRTITPSILNFFRIGYTRTYGTFAHASADGPSATEFGFKGIPAQALKTGGLPLISVSGYNQLGTRNFRPQFQKPELIQLADNMSFVLGKHSLRAGFETRQKNNSYLDSNRTVPAYTFNAGFTGEGLADLVLGQTYQFDANTQLIVEQLLKAYAGFVQDDWKVLPNLTINLGLRYEYTTPYYGADPNRNINVDLKTGQLVRAKSATDYTVNPDRSNIGPRIGMAWQAVPKRMVVRAGYGIFHSGEDMSGSDIALALNPNQLIPITLIRAGNTGPSPLPLSASIPTGLFENYNTNIVSLRARETDYKAGRIQQFNVATQFLLPLNSTFEIAYVGNRGKNLLAQFALNQTKFGVDGSIPANRPFPQWAAIQVGATRAESWYNALQLKYEKRFNKGWFTLASYTWASAIDQAGAWGAGSSPQYLDNFQDERGPQTQTPRQRFTLSNIYNLPIGRGQKWGNNWSKVTDAFLGGWQVSNILTSRTGLPLNVSLNGTSVDPRTNQAYRFFSRNGGGLRPDRVGNPNTGIDPKTDRARFLDPAAFRVQAVNTPGNSGRNVAYGPKLFNTDLSMVKHFNIAEKGTLDVRFEGFNIFNNVNFGNPATTYPNTDFGSITSARDPRVMQAVLRFRF